VLKRRLVDAPFHATSPTLPKLYRRQACPRSYFNAFAFLILLVLGAPQLSAAQDVKRTIERLDPMVTFVITGGEWRRGDEAGRVRIIVTSGGFEHVTSVLYVQWMLVDSDSGRMRITARKRLKSLLRVAGH
jgi:hypothetical protein